MWIFTVHGYVSVVAHRDHPDRLLVRARRAEHLQALFPDAKVHCTPKADYRYRADVAREQFLGRMLGHLATIDYDNFKAAIPDAEYHDAAAEVWQVMHRIQPGVNPYKATLSPYNHY